MAKPQGDPASRTEEMPGDPKWLRRSSHGPHFLEHVLVCVALVELGGLPWAFGGSDPLIEQAAAVVSLVALVIATLPRHSGTTDPDGRSRWIRMWPRLTGFPVFWLGLALLAYMAIQGLNPAYSYRIDGTHWWLEPQGHISWLPSGMITPFADMNGWRVMTIWGAVWAMVCALWVGITRRSSVVALLLGIEVNGFVFAAFGIVQRAGGGHSIYGVHPVGHPDFLAAFVYRNHAAAFFSLLGSVALGLTIRALWKGRSRLDPSGPAVIQLMLALTMIVALVISGSFAAIGLFSLMLVILLPLASWRYTTAFQGPGSDKPVFLTALALVAIAGAGSLSVGYDGLRERVDAFAEGGAQKASRIRLLAAHRGVEMLGDRLAYGWGAGSFRYGFTKYQRRDKELMQLDGAPVRWEHVHDDWLEFLIELGLVGFVPMALMAAYWIGRSVRLKLWQRLPILSMAAGLALLCLHAFMDLPLQNMAILATAGCLLPLLVRWGESEV